MSEPLIVFAEPSACLLLQLLIMIPLAAGVLLLLVPDRYMTVKGICALAVSLVSAYFSVSLYSSAPQMTLAGQTVRKTCMILFNNDMMQDAGTYLSFTIDGLSKLI